MRRAGGSRRGHIHILGGSTSESLSSRDDKKIKASRWKRYFFVSILIAIGIFSLKRQGYTNAGLIGHAEKKKRDANRKAELKQLVESLLEASEHGTLEDQFQRVKKRLASKQSKTIDDSVIDDSSTATVIAMASGYGLREFRRFVGSLRMTGYKGHIMLGMSPEMSPDVREYLEKRNVTMKLLQYTNCTYKLHEEAKKNKELRTCADPYPNIKLRWSRFPLARDWLEECKECTGPVLISDFRDTFFQRDPFVGASVMGLHVFEEHYRIKTTNWLTDWPIKECKGIQYDEPMLCSGTTAGTREAILKYLDAMYSEMKLWMADPNCNFGIASDDQSIHNYLYYSGKLPFAKAIPNRMGIVHTAGAQGSEILDEHTEYFMKTQNLTKTQATAVPFYGSDGDNRWLGKGFDLTDSEGYFINYDGTRSRVVHQYDRFGKTLYFGWFPKQEGKLWE